MAPFELKARVDSNGILTLSVPVGRQDADREVRVIVQPVDQPAASPDREAWRRFIEKTAGAWKGEPLIRAPQGEYEVREQWE